MRVEILVPFIIFVLFGLGWFYAKMDAEFMNKELERKDEDAEEKD